MAVKMNLRVITKNHAADQEIGFLTKSTLEPNDCATAMPTAWELRLKIRKHCEFRSRINSLRSSELSGGKIVFYPF